MANDKSRAADKSVERGESDDGEDRKKKQPFEMKKELIASPAADQELKSTKRVCGVCGKDFKSGKALGGHMRIHFLPSKHDQNKPNQRIKHLKKEAEIKKDPDQTCEIPRCPLCSKTFPSMKSMYGHMRSHPEREWRGSQPPPNTGGTGNDHDSPSRGMMRWSITAKRGCTGSKPISATSRNLIEQDKDLLEGATNMWLLSRGKTRADIPHPIQAAAPAPAPVVSIAKSTTTSEESAGGHIDNMTTTSSEESADEESSRKIIKHLKVNFKTAASDSCDIDDQRLITLKINCNNNKKKRKLQVMDLDPPRPQKHRKSSIVIGECSSSSKNQAAAAAEEGLLGKYKCSICGKRFVTYHGLGGHMSIHSKDRNTPQHDELSGRRSSSKQVDIGIISLYGCKWCKKNFSTAQALGGHKKCHMIRTTPLIINEPREEDNYVSQDRDHHVINLRLNLNEAPPHEDYGSDHHRSTSSSSSDDDDDHSPAAGEYSNH